MEPIKILIVDGNETFRSNLQRVLAGRYQVRTCRDGKEAQTLLETFQPQILVTELLLRELDGLSLIHYARGLSFSPAVLVVTIFSNDFVKTELSQLGVCGLVLKPSNLNTLVAHIHQLAKSADPIYSTRAEHFISRRLQELGIPCHRDGSNQLKVAIPMYTEDPSQPLNKVIYANVAKKCGFSDEKQVEHSIRTAIKTAWEQHSGTQWAELFPNGKPTNKAFISRLSAELSQYLLHTNEPAED